MAGVVRPSAPPWEGAGVWVVSLFVLLASKWNGDQLGFRLRRISVCAASP